jgi:phosphomannomutase
MNTETPYTHLFLDMDGTVTEEGAVISDEMRFLLSNLTQTVVVVSEADLSQMQYQLSSLPCYLLAQNGSHAVHKGAQLWEDRLTSLEIMDIESHIRSIPRTWDVPDERDLVDNRGCEISYSLYGHHAPLGDRKLFDPEGTKRRALLHAHPLRSERVEVRIVGATRLVYSRKGGDKGHNILRLIAHERWDATTCIYYGDEIFPGGSDESVYGSIETQGVKDSDDLYTRLAVYAQT